MASSRKCYICGGLLVPSKTQRGPGDNVWYICRRDTETWHQEKALKVMHKRINRTTKIKEWKKDRE